MVEFRKSRRTNENTDIVLYLWRELAKERNISDLQTSFKTRANVIKCTEITEKKNRSLLSSFSGCPKALHRKASKIAPAQIEQDADRFIVGCPIWAGFPAPAFNAIIPLIPDGKEVELFFCSGGGEEPKSKQGTL